VGPAIASVSLAAVATLVLLALASQLPRVNLVSIIYLIPVIIAATRWGLLAAVIAALAGALGADLLFYPPIFSLQIRDTKNLADLIVFLIAAVVTSNLAGRLKQERDNLDRRNNDLSELYELSRRLTACFTVADLVAAIEEHLSRVLRHPVVVVEADQLQAGADPAGNSGIPSEVRREAAALAVHAQTSQAVYPVTGQIWLIEIVVLATAKFVVFVYLGRNPPTSVEGASRRIRAAIQEAAATLTRVDVAGAIEEARLRFQTDRLKDALIGNVSHELRTPLAAILGSITVLDRTAIVNGDAQVRSLVDTVHDQASRLDTEIQKLLDAARIAAGAARPAPDWTDPADIVQTAIRSKARVLAAHQLNVVIDPNLPLIKLDSRLIEQAIAQVLENAAKYSPDGSSIAVSAKLERDYLVFSVEDQGIGLSAEELNRIGRRSFRSGRHPVPGSGLGLWVANAFIAASGGTLQVTSPGPGLGTKISIRLPILQNAPREYLAD
jgi:two-component system sensor histidine kinase KdpD